MVLGLNFMYGGFGRISSSVCVETRKPTSAQVASLHYLCEVAAFFVDSGTKAVLPQKDWQKELGRVSVSYTGQVVQRALPLTLHQVLPALPPKELSGKLDSVALAQGKVKEQLQDPALSLKLVEEWPEVLKQSKRDIFGIVQAQDILHHKGQPIAN